MYYIYIQLHVLIINDNYTYFYCSVWLHVEDIHHEILFPLMAWKWKNDKNPDIYLSAALFLKYKKKRKKYFNAENKARGVHVLLLDCINSKIIANQVVIVSKIASLKRSFCFLIHIHYNVISPIEDIPVDNSRDGEGDYYDIYKFAWDDSVMTSGIN